MKRRDMHIDWLDFARGVAAPEVDREIRRRLTSGSEADQKEVDLWRRVADVARADLEQSIPAAADAVRIVKAMGSVYLPRPAEAAHSLRRLVAQLAFGGGTPSPVGVRSLERVATHSVFIADGYIFDIRLDPGQAGACRLDGQVSRQESTSELDRSIPVFAFQGEDLMHSAFCDRLGEIHLDLEAAPSELHFLVEDDLKIEVPLV